MEKTRNRFNFVARALVSVTVSALPAMAFASTKTMQDLGTLGGNASFARGINENGVVVGESALSSGATRAFVYVPWIGHMTNLGTLGGDFSQAMAISNSGIAVGDAAAKAGDYCGKPVAWDTNNGGRVTILSELPPTQEMQCSHANAINDSGVIVGDSAGKAVRWVGGNIEMLYTINGANCWGQGINRLGDVVIQCYDSHQARGFVWSNGQVTEVLNGGASGFFVNAINSAGVVVGYGRRPNGNLTSFSWQNGVMSDLTTLGAYTNAHAISESGVIAGEASVNGSLHAVWWNWSHQIEDLGALPNSNFSSATGITSGGIVTGVSYVDTGAGQTSGNHAVLWK
jgi:probable HAF family extracellular repeat protein